MQELSVSYRLEEKATIPATWKALHLSFYFLACVSGILASVFFHSILSKLDDNCFLWASLHFKRDSREIDALSSTWRPREACDFYLYSHLLCSIFAVVWMVFFVMCARGGGTDGYIAQPWRIVTPASVFNILAFGIALNASVNFHVGVAKFCAFDLPASKPAEKRMCHDLQSVLLDGKLLGIELVHDISNCLTTQWLNTVFWFLGCCWSIARCLMAPDFAVVKVSVMAVPDEEERLQRQPESSDEDVIQIVEPSLSTSCDSIKVKKTT
ncbi:unnamed protein product [Bemisia tabaci]|uniref:Uncharacterized protein n=1 Tax=Bemisia tabaci TaxID=7038 RepID=A0A9P0AIS9_BEMTA|nr:unnamed protein product [Bemisia tabaci]